MDISAPEATYRMAQARFFEAKAAGQHIDNRTAAALATTAEIALKREERKEAWDAASNGRNRVYHFTDAVTPESVDTAIDVLNRWQRLDGEREAADPTLPATSWRFVICSGGGNVIHGMKLYSTLRAIGAYRDIITVASGICASMATVIHQAGTVRLIEPGCSYMVHDVSGEMFGKVSDMQDQMEWLNMLNGMLHVALAEKSKLSVEEVALLSKRRDSWFLPDGVIENGWADAIGYATE